MKKRILSILLTLCMVLCLMPTAAFAEGGTASADITGTGTAEDPYLIYTAAGLKEFQRRVNAAERDAHAKLVSDIVLNDGTFDEDGNYTKGESGMDAEKWEPICDFRGTFDGNGKTIKGLYVNGGEYAGLFGGSPFAATVKNVAVTGYVSGKTAGGIAGEMLSGSISNCLNYCTVTGSDLAGGIVGRSDAMINSCGNRSSVSGSKVVGGIIGDLNGNTIANCYNTGSVSCSGSRIWVGGIAGAAGSGTGITNCYNAGSVSGSAGGSDIEQLIIGGIAGSSGYNTIANCYNAGQVSSADGTGYIGGIVGSQRSGTVNNCYYPTGVADNGIGYTDYSPTVTNTEAKSKSDFANGTVLNLLKNDNENSPWTKCGYLAAAGMTLPLLSWQTADAHTHNKNGDLGGCDCGQLPAGTADDPYLISNAQELKQFRDMVNGGNTGICAKLMNDIVLNDGAFDENGNWSKSGTPDQWTPIGDISNPYVGTFDGGGHTIRGLYINRDESGIGLFRIVSNATIKNLTVTGYVKGYGSVGGIVGGILEEGNATIQNCANYCEVTGDTYVGGIVGYIGYNTKGDIRNCANFGTVKGTCTDSSAYVGGIVGYASIGQKMTVVCTACYNVGTVKAKKCAGGLLGYGSMKMDSCYNVGLVEGEELIGGLVGDALWLIIDGTGMSLVTVDNCYYLDTATKAFGEARFFAGDTSAWCKSKAQFADGTVLKLLKQNDTTNAWQSKCGYLAAAGMTLPLLDWQTADAHTHDYQWKYNNTEHWKECSCGFIEQGSNAAHKEVTGICTDGIKCECGYEMHTATGWHDYPEDWTAVRPGSTHIKACRNPGCGVRQSNSCTGGTATCKEQATCEVCGEGYGALANHSFTAETAENQYLKSAATCAEQAVYYKSCAVCGEKGTETFTFGNPNGHNWGAWTQDSGNDTHTHKCQNAGCTASETDNCSGGTADCTHQATCSTCGEKYGAVDPSNHTGTAVWIPTATTHVKKYSCCDAIEVAETAHHWENGVCTECGYGCAHSGGEASCTSQAVCTVCGHPYGDLNPHDFTAENTDEKYLKTAATCTEQAVYYKSCAVCGLSSASTADEATFQSGDALDHDYGAWTSNGDGTHTRTCTRDAQHTETKACSGGTATCVDKATCEVCGAHYGAVAASNHTGGTEVRDAKAATCTADGYTGDTYCKGCDALLTNGKAISATGHTGSTATCKDKAVCEICGESYGELDVSNHADMKHIEAKAATKTAEGNIEYWHCEDCGKYFADKNGNKEITKADTVTAKLPDDSQSPQTGDNSNLMLWIALLFISGGAVTATTVYVIKKKRSVK